MIPSLQEQHLESGRALQHVLNAQAVPAVQGGGPSCAMEAVRQVQNADVDKAWPVCIRCRRF